MRRPQRPLFSFLWPSPDPHAPVNGHYRQTRLVRITPRGPLRLLILGVGTIVTVFLLTAALLTAIESPLSAATFVAAGVAATCVAVVLRGWVVGTFVNDDGIVMDTLLRRTSISWTSVAAVACLEDGARLLGTHLRVPGRRIVLITTSGQTHETHLSSASLDLLWRREAFSIAQERLENWASDA